MSLIGSFIGLVRDFLTERFDDAFAEKVSGLKWLGLPVGGLLAFAVVIGLHAASYNAFEDRENSERVVRKLEEAGYREPVVEHLWIGGLCFQAGHPYQWRAGRVHGTACVGDWLGLTIHGGSRWWPFGRPEPPEKQ